TQIKEVPSSSPLGALAGKVPGASVITASGQPGSEQSIRLRSATSLTGRQDPLVIVDGTITRLGLADLNSEDIERVEIIKGAAASSLYGSDASWPRRSEEHTSELQSLRHLVCRLLLEKKN